MINNNRDALPTTGVGLVKDAYNNTPATEAHRPPPQTQAISHAQGYKHAFTLARTFRASSFSSDFLNTSKWMSRRRARAVYTLNARRTPARGYVWGRSHVQAQSEEQWH